MVWVCRTLEVIKCRHHTFRQQRDAGSIRCIVCHRFNRTRWWQAMRYWYTGWDWNRSRSIFNLWHLWYAYIWGFPKRLQIHCLECETHFALDWHTLTYLHCSIWTLLNISNRRFSSWNSVILRWRSWALLLSFTVRLGCVNGSEKRRQTENR